MRRIFRIILGFSIVLAGLVLAIPGVPGPGIPIAIVGLVILAEHYHWARRLLDWGKARAERLRRRNS